MSENLHPGRTYRIRHKRKGEFEALLVAVERTKEGDPDAELLRVRINTEEGSPCAWMAHTREYRDGKKTTPRVTEKLLRPSLIESIQQV